MKITHMKTTRFITSRAVLCGASWVTEYLWQHQGCYGINRSNDVYARPFDGRSVRPYLRAARQSWLGYHAWVAANGKDPLNQYTVTILQHR